MKICPSCEMIHDGDFDCCDVCLGFDADAPMVFIADFDEAFDADMLDCEK